MPANFDGTSAEPQPNKNTEDVNNRKNKENIPNEQLSEKEEQKRTNHGLTAPLRTIKNQSKKEIQNGPLRSTTRERIYRDHLWKIYTSVT